METVYLSVHLFVSIICRILQDGFDENSTKDKTLSKKKSIYYIFRLIRDTDQRLEIIHLHKVWFHYKTSSLDGGFAVSVFYLLVG